MVTWLPVSFGFPVSFSIRSSVAGSVAATAHFSPRDAMEGANGLFCAEASAGETKVTPPAIAAAARQFRTSDFFMGANSVERTLRHFECSEEFPAAFLGIDCEKVADNGY